jgi:hypothetical protein
LCALFVYNEGVFRYISAHTLSGSAIDSSMSTASKSAGSQRRELKRRKVLKTCVYYIVVSCAVLFLVDQLLPDTRPSAFLVYVALLGLPVTAICAWFFQASPEATTRTTSFVERRVLRNMAPINDKRHGGYSRQEDSQDYRWIITAESGPLKGLKYGVLDSIVVGRSLENDLALVSPEISRRHARFELDGEQLFVEDLGSSAGTRINGEVAQSRRALQDGDEVRFADVVFRVSAGPEAG